MNDMYLDPETFDFSMIADEVESDVPEQELRETHVREGDYLEDLDLDGDEDEVEDDGDITEDDILKQAMEDSFESYSKFGDKFDEMPDDVEFTINGAKINKAQIKEVVQMNEEVRRTREVLSAYEQKIVDIEKDRIGKIEAARWETSELITKFEQALHNPQLSNDQYRQVRESLDTYRSKMSRLNEIANEAASDFARSQHEAAMQRITATVEVMRKEIPNYVEKVGPELMQYALDSGMNANELKSAMSPALVRALQKAKKLDELQARSRAKGKGEEAPVARSTRTKAKGGKQTSAAQGGSRKASREEAAAYKRYLQGNMQDGDSSLIFKFLD